MMLTPLDPQEHTQSNRLHANVSTIEESRMKINTDRETQNMVSAKLHNLERSDVFSNFIRIPRHCYIHSHSRPCLYFIPIVTFGLKCVYPSIGFLRITKIRLLHRLRLDDDNSKILPRSLMLEVFHFCAKLVVLLIIRSVLWLPRWRVFEGP
jgi:hypothetical protein